MTNYRTFNNAIYARNGGQSVSAVMAFQLWFCLVVVISSLLQSTLADTKKKIIVKVPHVIKHIHHDVFKPVHIHKVSGKKVEHHHHEEHEEIKGWKPVKKTGHKKTKYYKPHGSFSQLHPVLAVQNIDEHTDYLSSSRQEEPSSQEHLSGQDFIQEEILHLGNSPGKRKVKFNNGKVLARQNIHEHTDYPSSTRQEQPYSQEHRFGQDFIQEDILHSGNSPGKRKVKFNNGKVLARQNIHEHTDYPSITRQEQPYSQEHRSGQDFIQEEILHSGNSPGKRKVKFNNGKVLTRQNIQEYTDYHSSTRQEQSPRGLSSWKPHEAYEGEVFDDFDDYSEVLESSREKLARANGQRRKRQKKINSNPTLSLERTKSKRVSSLLDDSEWTPLQSFGGWKDLNGLGNKPRTQSTHLINPQEGRFGNNFEEHIYEIERGLSDEESHTKEYKKPRRSKKNKPKWSKPIDVKEPIDEVENTFGASDGRNMHQFAIPVQFKSDNRNMYQVETPVQLIPQFPSQTHQSTLVKPQFDFKNFQTQQLNPQSHQNQPSSWSLQLQQPQLKQETHSLKQSTNNIWSTQPTPVVAPTQPPKVFWSGHHLQMPQSSMWHVQQHSVQGDSSQMFSNFHPPLQVHQAQLSSPMQLPQGSAPVQQQVLPPGWPLTHKSHGEQSPVKQQWEQHVQTSGSNGPASSYKLEVINYMDQKKAHH